jgi:anti-sigma B factor antagonist
MSERLGNDERRVVPDFRVNVENVNSNQVVIDVEGELDIATAPILLQAIQAVFEDPITSLAVSLDRLTFMDSTGINVLLITQRTAQRRGIRFALAAVAPQARQALDATGLSDLFGLRPLNSS